MDENIPKLPESAGPEVPSGAGTERETFRITLVQGGDPCAYCEDLTDLPNGPLSADHDLQWRLGLLFPLREWLDVHGAFTSGSGVRVHNVCLTERPEDIAEAGPITGRIIDTCEVTTSIRGTVLQAVR